MIYVNLLKIFMHTKSALTCSDIDLLILIIVIRNIIFTFIRCRLKRIS